MKSLRCLALVVVVATANLLFAGQYVLRTIDPETGQTFKNPSGGTISWSGGNSVAYSGSAGWYGESRQDFQYVTCEGTITTIFDWKRVKLPGTQTDDPLDNPPEYVVSAERCTAGFYIFWYPFQLGGGGYANNGLGFAAQTGGGPVYLDLDGGQMLIGYEAYGSSQGTLYTKRAGGDSITLTCTPSAWVLGDGDMVAGVSYSAKIITPTVALPGTTRFYDPSSVKFLTGQKVTAYVTMGITPGPQEIEGLQIDPTSYQWAFEGGFIAPFKEYIHTSTLGRLEGLLPEDYKHSFFNFYTNQGATTKVVCDFKFILPAEAKFAGGLPNFHAKSKEVESVRPGYAGWDVRDGKVKLFAPDRIEFAADGIASNGQQWLNARYNEPSGFGPPGKGCFCQLITADRHLYRTVTLQGQLQGAFTHFINTLNALEALDVSFPYPLDGQWTLPALGTGRDSPVQYLYMVPPPDAYTYAWVEATANDTFQTWAMYRPPSKDNQPTTWIPMAKYTWYWKGTATLGPNGWVLSGDDGRKNGDPGPEFVHPEWTRVSGSIQFIGIYP